MSRMRKNQRIYLDYAAGAPLDQRVFTAMKPYFSRAQGNPSAIYKEGMEARNAVESARAEIARAVSARADEIIFTSGGTEANNLAIFGVARATRKAGIKKPHIVTSVIEHPSVLNACRALEKNGDADVDYIGVDESGIINLSQLKKALCPETILVSIMYANNEIGTIQPIKEIAKIIRWYRKNHLDVGRQSALGRPTSKLPYFHTDACQAMNYLDINVERLGVDLLTFNGAKIYGPKGVGALYKKRNTTIAPMLYGGGQENGMRSGTENVPMIVGLARALLFARADSEKESARQVKLRDYFISQLSTQSDIACPTVNGSLEHRLPNNINVSFPNIESQLMVIELDARGIAASSKSACSSEDEDASYVVSALGGEAWRATNSARFSFGKQTTKNDINKSIKALSEIVKKYSIV